MCVRRLTINAIALAMLFAPTVRATGVGEKLKNEVDKQAQALMQNYHIPGMAFGVVVEGKAYFYNYGVADTAQNQPVSEATIFELGSVSKTFAATLASYAQVKGQLSLTDTAEQHMPELKGSTIGARTLQELGTYIAGGLPLQFPDTVKNNQDMVQYYRNWDEVYPSNTKRVYSNPSIGLFGYIAALSLKEGYVSAMEKNVFPALSMSNTYIHVPDNKMKEYAFGYNANGEAVRVNPGVLDAEAYGVKSTSSDMVQYIKANLGLAVVATDMQQALVNNRTGFYQSSTFMQGLAWEMYPYPSQLSALLEGNSTDVIIKPQTIQINTPPTPPTNGVWVNKTGSTGGFGAYVVYIPSKESGIVILANKNYPNQERVKAAFRILQAGLEQ
ncbi:class C beta-lactamase [Vibrio sp. V01_P9A10T6]|uniref:class C beta-lactamase n=1 Tax=Vibrio sp. V01_P9A10T6 TaxID=2116368 RepID=UPI000D04504B|nr:class C beta-lactamase [Vibrio sp. V01_P9A10T6]